MRAMPVKLVPGHGYLRCVPSEATHVTLHFPGPSGRMTLPVIIRGPRAALCCWTWNGDMEKPTLMPSVLTQGTRPVGDDPMVVKQFRCHTWVNDGRAQFLPDTTHELSVQTVDMLEVEDVPCQ